MIATLRLLALCLLLQTGCSNLVKPGTAGSGDYTLTLLKTRQLIQELMDQYQVQGLSIALIDDQQLIWAQGFGYADKKNARLVDADTRFNVGSISKLFTASATMLLAEQGRLQIDQPVTNYLPKFSIKNRFAEPVAPITLRQLMSHHSGLPRDIGLGAWNPKPVSFTHNLDVLQNQYLAYRPGSLFAYSNIAVSLLGQIIQQQSGQDFATYLKTDLLEPLGMRNAYFSPVIGDDTHDSKGYDLEGEETSVIPLRDVPAGGMHASVNDLSQFIKMTFADGRYAGRQILKPESMAEMLRVQNADVPLDLDLHMGLGWILSGMGVMDIRNAGPVAYHAGDTLQFHSQLILLQQHKLGVVVLGNSVGAAPAVRKIAVEALKHALEAKVGIKQPKRVPVLTDDNPVPESTLQAFTGEYTTLAGAVRVKREGDDLQAEIADKSLYLVQRPGGWFGMEYRLFGLIPIPQKGLEKYVLRREQIAGREVLVAGNGQERVLVGERMPVQAISDAWRQRLGDYEIVNRGDDYALFAEQALIIKDEHLYLHLKLVPELGGDELDALLQAQSDKSALMLNALADSGESIEVEQSDAGELLHCSGYVLKRKAD